MTTLCGVLTVSLIHPLTTHRACDDGAMQEPESFADLVQIDRGSRRDSTVESAGRGPVDS